ncbi:hypothetical protein MRB53_038105 [Persea americana]|nr:hypothetical protein MRB53_038105 [Persea americana]
MIGGASRWTVWTRATTPIMKALRNYARHRFLVDAFVSQAHCHGQTSLEMVDRCTGALKVCHDYLYPQVLRPALLSDTTILPRTHITIFPPSLALRLFSVRVGADLDTVQTIIKARFEAATALFGQAAPDTRVASLSASVAQDQLAAENTVQIHHGRGSNPSNTGRPCCGPNLCKRQFQPTCRRGMAAGTFEFCAEVRAALNSTTWCCSARSSHINVLGAVRSLSVKAPRCQSTDLVKSWRYCSTLGTTHRPLSRRRFVILIILSSTPALQHSDTPHHPQIQWSYTSTPTTQHRQAYRITLPAGRRLRSFRITPEAFRLSDLLRQPMPREGTLMPCLTMTLCIRPPHQVRVHLARDEEIRPAREGPQMGQQRQAILRVQKCAHRTFSGASCGQRNASAACVWALAV